MSSRERTEKILSSIALTTSGIYGLYLYVSRDILLYINPRYELLSLAASLICLFAGIISFYYISKDRNKYINKSVIQINKAVLPTFIGLFF